MVPDSFSALLERYKAVRAHELELNRATAEFERAVLQPMFLLNGGASVAVLGLLGAWSDRIIENGIHLVHIGLYFWSLGLVAAAVASLFGYFSQRNFTRAERLDREGLEAALSKYPAETPAASDGTEKRSPKELRASAKIYQQYWWILVALSLVSFVLGVGETAFGLAQTMPQITASTKVATDVAPSLDASALALVLGQPSRTAPWVTPFFFLAGLGALCGLLMALFGKGNVVRGVGTALAVSSIFGGTAVTFFKDVQVKLPELKLSASEASTAPALERMTPVGPFAVGKANVLEPQSVPSVVAPDDAAKNVIEKAKGRGVAYVLFIGSADKFELLPQLQTQYGSNIGLARARAEWVGEQVRLAWKGHPFESVALTVGPNMHGIGLSSQDTAGDRSVAIYVAWRERREEGGIRDWLKSLNTKSEAVEGKR